MCTDCRVWKAQCSQGTERTWKEANRAKGLSFCGVSNVTPMSRISSLSTHNVPCSFDPQRGRIENVAQMQPCDGSCESTPTGRDCLITHPTLQGVFSKSWVSQPSVAMLQLPTCTPPKTLIPSCLGSLRAQGCLFWGLGFMSIPHAWVIALILSWCMQGHVWSRRGSIPGGAREMSSELSGGP